MRKTSFDLHEIFQSPSEEQRRERFQEAFEQYILHRMAVPLPETSCE